MGQEKKDENIGAEKQGSWFFLLFREADRCSWMYCACEAENTSVPRSGLIAKQIVANRDCKKNDMAQRVGSAKWNGVAMQCRVLFAMVQQGSAKCSRMKLDETWKFRNVMQKQAANPKNMQFRAIWVPDFLHFRDFLILGRNIWNLWKLGENIFETI